MIYITGATGFIGSRVAARFLQRGEKVRCLVRSRARAAQLLVAGAELIEGDIGDQRVHERGMDGARGAIHLAAIYDIGIVDRRMLWRTNVEGTSAFLAAVKSQHLERAVYVSSTVALGPGTDEPAEAYTGPYHSVYHETKAESHRRARAAQRSGDHVIIVCPSFVYGPGDEGPAGRFISDILGRKLPALLSDPAWFSYVYVDDVADGIVAALDRGRIGETYLLTGEAASMTDYAKLIGEIAGVKPPAMRFPVAIAKPLGRVLDVLSRATRIRFPITHEAVVTTSRDRWLHTHERARRDLDYKPRSLREGVGETLRNYNLAF